MPYQPTNPYPYNMAIDLKEGLQFRFKVDNYDVIESFKIELYDIFTNEKLYTIIRTVEEDIQKIKILDENEKIILYEDYTNEDFKLPIRGGLGSKSFGEVDVTDYLVTIEAIERKKYYGDTEGYATLSITDSECFVIDDNGEIIQYKEENNTGDIANIVIPYRTSKGLVKSIGDDVFRGNSNLETVVVPASIKTIGQNAFNSCDVLYKVSLNYGISIIEDYCFQGCIALRDINLLDSIYLIGQGAFEGCNSLESIHLPWSLEKISANAFVDTSLVEINLPANVKIVAEKAFFNCVRLRKFVGNEQLQSIESQAFGNCEELTSVILRDNLNFLGEEVFMNCKVLTEIVIPDNVETISQGILKGCNTLQSLTLPFIGLTKNDNNSPSSVLGHFFGGGDSSSIQQIYDINKNKKYYNIPTSLQKIKITNAVLIPCGAFSNCNMIQEVTLNSNISRIEAYSFYNCALINEIELPSNITYIGDYAFALENSRLQ